MYVDGLGSAAESAPRRDGGAAKTAAERDEHRSYLAKLAASDPDPGVRRIAERLLKELDEGAVTKSAVRPDGEKVAYLGRLAQHADPEIRLRAQAQLDIGAVT